MQKAGQWWEITVMSDVANLDEASKCLEIASAALQSGNLDKAARFAEKAMRLHPHDEASP